ncbi:MAG: hypothetical protein ACLQPD_16365, partial [Desulfomonilaceae bacterium]
VQLPACPLFSTVDKQCPAKLWDMFSHGRGRWGPFPLAHMKSNSASIWLSLTRFLRNVMGSAIGLNVEIKQGIDRQPGRKKASHLDIDR